MKIRQKINHICTLSIGKEKHLTRIYNNCTSTACIYSYDYSGKKTNINTLTDEFE